jgi:tetratricopeptide (TPR) repeat protein
MDWNDRIADGWNRHAADAAGVLDSLAAALSDSPPSTSAIPLGALITHVSGEHLGRWADGEALLERVRAGVQPGSAEDRALWRNVASLRRCAQDDAGAEAAVSQAIGDASPEASHRARVEAVAAAAMVGQGDLPRATDGYRRACALGAELPDADPAIRALAVTSNNLAQALEEGPRNPERDGLLRQAAANSRRFWEKAGTWMNVERAEYRLAMTHLVLGEPATALRHAQACLDTILANQGDGLERLFGWEAVARARLALGETEAARAALVEAEAALGDVMPDMRDYCAGELAKVRAQL